jgi:hypothetical protein
MYHKLYFVYNIDKFANYCCEFTILSENKRITVFHATLMVKSFNQQLIDEDLLLLIEIICYMFVFHKRIIQIQSHCLISDISQIKIPPSLPTDTKFCWSGLMATLLTLPLCL